MMNFKIKLTGCLLSTLLFSTTIWAQKTKNFVGIMELDGINGIAKYSYFTSLNDTLKHGLFSLEIPIQENQEAKVFITYSINGHFKRNIPHGIWEMKRRTFLPTGNGYFKDYAYAFDINGSEFYIKGEFNDGKMNKQWDIFERRINESSLTDTLFAVSMNFKNNVPVGKFNLQKNKKHLHAELDNKGFTQGKWIFKSIDEKSGKQIHKEWIFENNQLMEEVITIGNETKRLAVVHNASHPSVLEEMEVNKKYFQLIDFKASINNLEVFRFGQKQDRVRDLYVEVMKTLFNLDFTLHPVINATIYPVIKVKIVKYPYSESESASLNTIKRNYSKTDSLVSLIQNDAQVTLSKRSTPKVAKHASIINSIKTKYLLTLDSFVNLYKDGYLEYVNRNTLISKSINFNAEFSHQYHVEKDTFKERVVLFNTPLKDADDNLKKLEMFTGELYNVVRLLNDSLKYLMTEIKKEIDLVDQEELLVSKFENTKILIDSIIGPLSLAVGDFDLQNSLRNFVETELDNYSKLPGKEKRTRIQPLIDCMGKVEGLINTLTTIPRNIEIIEKAYTHNVFNPYTFTDMEEKIKQPIYKSYYNVILPALLQNLSNLTCDKIDFYNNNFKHLFEGMLEILKSTNTRKIERKVKKTSDAQKAVEILGLNIKF